MAKKRHAVPMNDGFAEDKHLHHLEEAQRTARWFRSHPAASVDGTREVDYRCLTCGTVNRAPLETQANAAMLPCGKCGTTQEQERIW